jgi:hypothetical protein
VFQQPGGALRAISGLDWSAESKYLVTAAVGTSLSMARVPYGFDSPEERQNRTSVSLLYGRDGLVSEFVYNRKYAYGWQSAHLGVFRNFASVSGTAAASRFTIGVASGNCQALAVGMNPTGVISAAALLSNGSWERQDMVKPPVFFNRDGSSTESGSAAYALL